MKRSPEPCNVFQTTARRDLQKPGEVGMRVGTGGCEEGCAAAPAVPDGYKIARCDTRAVTHHTRMRVFTKSWADSAEGWNYFFLMFFLSNTNINITYMKFQLLGCLSMTY